MKTFNYQDIYFNLKKSIYSGDNTLNSLKKYEENKLKSYFNQSIINFCKDYFTEFQKKFNEIVENLMNSKGDDSEINIHIEDCFSSKLKIFGEKMNFQFNYDNFRKIDINSSFEIISNLKTDDEILLIVDEKKIKINNVLNPYKNFCFLILKIN